MKILLAVHHFPPRYSAGAELYAYRLARWLLANGHQAEVVCVEELDPRRPAGLAARREDYGGVPVQRLSLGMAGAPASWAYDHALINAWLHDHLERSRPDLVHLHSGYLLGAGVIDEAHAAGLPAVVTLHDYWFLCPRFTLLRGDGRLCAEVPADPAACAWCLKLDQRRFRLPERLSGGAAGKLWAALAGSAGREAQAERRARLRQALGRASLVVAPSRFLAEIYGDAIRAEQLLILRYGLDISNLTPTPLPPEDRPLRIGYIGQIAPHKGVHVLVEAVQRLPAAGRPLEVMIYGNPEQNPAYTQQLRRLIRDDPRIRLAGRFENSRLGEILDQCAATVVPSVWYENSPLAIMEAHAAGRPVIASAMGGMAELVRHGVDGLHFAPGDAADLARQIQRLRSEPGLLAKLAAGIRAPVSIDDEMMVLAAAYERIIAQTLATSCAGVA